MPFSRHIYPLLFGAIAVLCGLAIGADIGFFNIALPHLQTGLGLDNGQVGTLSVAMPLGIVIGALGTGALSDAWGRKKTLIGAILAFAAGIAFCVTARAYWPLLAGRSLVGVAIGMYYTVVPVFLSESLATKARGVCMVLFALASAIGIFAAMRIGACHTGWVDGQLAQVAQDAAQTALIHDRAWRRLLTAAALPAAALLPAALCAPESPRWLFARGKKDRTLAVLTREHPPEKAAIILREMEVLAETEPTQAARVSLWQRRYLWPLGLVSTMVFFNNAVGAGVLGTFSTTMLGQAGLSAPQAASAGAWAAAMNLLGIGIGLLAVTKLGRKTMMVWGLAGALLAAIAAATLLWLVQGEKIHLAPETGGWLLFACLGTYVLTLAFGPGTCGWLLLSELLPTRVRSTGTGTAILLGSAANIGMLKLHLPIVSHWGLGTQWALWSAMAGGYLGFCLFLLPETRGKTLEEIEALFTAKD